MNEYNTIPIFHVGSCLPSFHTLIHSYIHTNYNYNYILQLLNRIISSFRTFMEVNIDQDNQVQTLEAIKGGGGSIKVGTTGTINALMTRELLSIKVGSPKTVPSTVRSPKTALEPNDAAKDTKPKARVQADEASTSSSNTMSEKHASIPQKTKHHHTRKGSRNPILHHSDSVSVDGSGGPNTRKNDKKGSCMVEIVDIKCGVPDKNWANPITNRFKKLSFSKLSETNGVK
ncbi:hypothetical protein L6452_00044 [Arctium lappa]|uniref:Uncharacterized protein n=1 Tax=Arctium lappa TaxID=4217 RepID=A0ACB9FDT4_ARCLA|nr:hypothetical protein L6452_00044 [Arctium lappa]